MTDINLNPKATLYLRKLSIAAKRRPDKSLGTFCGLLSTFSDLGYNPDYLIEMAEKNYNGGDFSSEVEEFVAELRSRRAQGLIL